VDRIDNATYGQQEPFSVEFRKTRYAGYRSFDYLRDAEDYPVFDMTPEFGHYPLYDLGLDEQQVERTVRLIDDNLIISLHDHPQIFPASMQDVHPYLRTGRQLTSYAGLSRSGMTAVFDNMMDGIACITSTAGWKWDDIIIDLGMRLADLAHQDYVVVARSLDDLRQAKENGRLAMVMSLEAATMIENEVDRIDILYGLGVRQMGIAYSEANTLGSGLKEARDGGLTVFGKRAVQRMNTIGMSIDVSHSGDQTCLDVFEQSSKPVFITHAGARAIWNTARMMPDEVLRACAETGGVIGIEAAPHTSISEAHPTHTLESVMDHFEYCANLMGIDHVAFGPDTQYGDHVGLHDLFVRNLGLQQADGPAHQKVEYIAGIDNPTENYFNIIGWLVKHGYRDEDIIKVTSTNIIRILEQVW